MHRTPCCNPQTSLFQRRTPEKATARASKSFIHWRARIRLWHTWSSGCSSTGMCYKGCTYCWGGGRQALIFFLKCEQLLETLKDAAEDAHARVEDENCQIGQILSIFDCQKMQVDLHRQDFEPSQASPHEDWSICLSSISSQHNSWAGSHSATVSSFNQSGLDSDGDSCDDPSAIDSNL